MRDCGDKTSAPRCCNVPETCLEPRSALKNQIAMLTGLVQQAVGGQPGSGEAGGWGMLVVLAGGPLGPQLCCPARMAVSWGHGVQSPWSARGAGGHGLGDEQR